MKERACATRAQANEGMSKWTTANEGLRVWAILEKVQDKVWGELGEVRTPDHNNNRYEKDKEVRFKPT